MRRQMKSWLPSTYLAFFLMVLTVWFTAAMTLGAQAWAWAVGTPVPLNPFMVVLAAVRGQLPGAGGMWWTVAGAGLLLVVLPAGVWALSRRGRAPIDRAASLTGRKSATASINEGPVRATAKRLKASTDILAPRSGPRWLAAARRPQAGFFGLPIGLAVNDGRRLWTSFEFVNLVVAGPRTGKTTSWVVPRIWSAPGLVVATSNKRDIVDLTRQVRSQVGQVWVFDPQGLTGQEQSWWWDILSYVTDSVSAGALTELFIGATRDASAQTSAYFDQAAKDLVSALLLAAARSGQTILSVHKWLSDQTDREPLTILRRAGEEMVAQELEGIMNLVSETRSGVYGSASAMVSFLKNDKAMRWVTPQPHLPELRTQELIRSTDTLYCLSQEGRGNAAPIVTALTVAVSEGAMYLGKSRPGGRLETPMLLELDEAANVCPWPDLPKQYSHLGSTGIVVDTILQSYAQGVERWGEAGMRMLWSATNVVAYLGGVKEVSFLSDLSSLIGEYRIDSTQTSYSSASGTSTSTSQEADKRPITTVDELWHMPTGRAWVLAANSQAVLVKTIPCYKRTPPTYTRFSSQPRARPVPAPVTATAAVVQATGTEPEPESNPWITERSLTSG